MRLSFIALACLIGVSVVGQLTYVPDDNFEAFLEANGMGNGVLDDNYVTTANISSVNSLLLDNQIIFDLTGIEDFYLLQTLFIRNMYLTELDLSNNIYLSNLYCTGNQLACIDVSGCNSLYQFWCENNFLTQLDLSNNISLGWLAASSNPFLNCIQTNTNNVDFNYSLDQNTSINTDCGYESIINCNSTMSIESYSNKNKELLKITNQMGQEVNSGNNQILFYIYDDGSVEKKFIAE